MKAFEDSTGKPLEEEKKELASEELIITGSLGEDIGADKATGIVNDIKTEIIKNNTSDTIQIADTINNITNNYNVTLTPEQQQQLDELGEGVNQGFFDSIKNWFSGIGDWFAGLFGGNEDKDLGILGSTDDSVLGENAIIDATDKDAINLPSSEEVEGFFAKIWNWFTGLFNSDNSKEESNSGSTEDSPVDSLEQNSTVDENVQPDSSVENEPQDNENTNDSSNLDNLNTLDSNSSNEETIN